MAALRFRFAPPAGGHGVRGNNALTIKLDHSVGADQEPGPAPPERGEDIQHVPPQQPLNAGVQAHHHCVASHAEIYSPVSFVSL